MRKLWAVGAGALLTAVIAGSVIVAAPAWAVDAVVPDAALKDCIIDKLAADGTPAGDPIQEEDLAQLSTLSCENKGIQDLAGLEKAVNLTELRILNNRITDLSPVAALTTLTYLDAYGNQVAGLSSLSGLTDLRTLVVGGNQITDLSPLTGLKSLTDLRMHANQITDLSPLAGLTSLKNLRVFNNEITDLSPVSSLTALTYLDASSNLIADVSPVSALTKLTHLGLQNNRIADVSPVGHLAALTYLDIRSNRIVDVSPVGALSLVTSFTAANQTVAWEDVHPATAIPNPVKNREGAFVGLVETSNPALGFLMSVDDAQYAWARTGAGAGSWDDGNLFSGTFTQTVTAQVAVPEAPVVTQGACAAGGGSAAPALTLAQTPGMRYSTDRGPACGTTVIVTATPQDGYLFPAEMPDGWRRADDGATATYRVVFEAVADAPDDVDCAPGDAGSAAGGPGVTPGAAGNGSTGALATTGAEAPLVALSAAVALMIGGALLWARRAGAVPLLRSRRRS